MILQKKNILDETEMNAVIARKENKNMTMIEVIDIEIDVMNGIMMIIDIINDIHIVI